MSEQPRRHLPATEKVAILKRHLLEGVPISQLCDEAGIKPSVFYNWQKLLFENAHVVFENGRKPKAAEGVKDKRIEQLEGTPCSRVWQQKVGPILPSRNA